MFDMGVHHIHRTHLSMEKRWKMLAMEDIGEGRKGKRSHTATEKEDSFRTGGSTEEETSHEDNLIVDKMRYRKLNT